MSASTWWGLALRMLLLRGGRGAAGPAGRPRRHRRGRWPWRRCCSASSTCCSGCCAGCAATAPTRMPDAGGAWGDVIGLVARLYRRKQYHKRRMRQLLRELRNSTAAIPDGVVMLNPAAEILWFNRAAAELLHLRSPGDAGAAHRQPGAPPGIRRLPAWRRLPLGGGGARRRGVGGAVPALPGRPLWGRAAAADGARRDARGPRSRPCARTSSPTPRTSCARR